jgi:hypothetical protein
MGTVFSVLIGGVVASMLAAFLSNRFVAEPLWRDDTVELMRRTGILESGLYDFRDNFPKVIAADNLAGLFGFCPITSEELALRLGEQVGELYARHYRRIAVMSAEDVYVLMPGTPRSVRVGDTDSKVWDLLFSSKWTWKNDSRVPIRPFKDFAIVVSTPDGVRLSVTDQERKRRLEEYTRFLRSTNCVRTIIVNPVDDSKVAADDRGHLICDQKLIIDSHSGQKSVDLKPRMAPPDHVFIYEELVVAAEQQELELNVGESISIEYTGKISVPAYEDKKDSGRYSGVIRQPFSDFILGDYAFYFGYQESETEIVTSDSGYFHNHVMVGGSQIIHDKTKIAQYAIVTDPHLWNIQEIQNTGRVSEDDLVCMKWRQKESISHSDGSVANG